MNLPRTLWIPVGLAIASVLVQAVILRVLTKQKLRSDFRIFFIYNACAVVIGIAAIIGYIRSCCMGYGYTYFYWAMSVVFMLLEFGVMYEVFANIVKPYSALIDLGKLLFRWAGAFLVLGTLLTAFTAAGPQSTKFYAAVHLLDRSLHLMQCGLLLLFFSFERRLNLSWRSPSVIIALGLGTSAAVSLIISALSEHFSAATVALGIVDSFVYLTVAVFWATGLALPQPERTNVLDSPTRLIFQRWNEALQTTPLAQDRSAALASVESFLPGIEKTVDRVMARKAVL